MDAFEFPDVEDVLKTYLADELADTPCVTIIPNPRPAAFVRLLRLGGPRATKVSDRPTVAVECWGTDRGTAHALARRTRRHLAELPGEFLGDAVVHRVDELSGPANLPDPTSDQARYTFSVAVHLSGALPTGS